MNNLPFRKITLADKEEIQSYTFKSYSRNCDLNFMNLCSWQFLYNTEFAVAHGWLVFRFYADGHLAYMLPCQKRDPHDILNSYSRIRAAWNARSSCLECAKISYHL